MTKDSKGLLNTTIAHYRVLEKIGAGGMGEVFLAEDIRLKRRIALKILPVEVAADMQRLRRFIQEATAISALNHPNILTIHDIGKDQDTNFIATEFVQGKTLRRLINERQIGLAATLEIAQQLASALAAAHQAGIVHRDIKPENVMLRRDGFVKVLDFGLAKLTEPKSVSREDSTLPYSTPGVVRGTVAYMSPEQARGLKLDHRTDIWSFGVVLYELLALRLPFTGETAMDQMLSIIQKEPPDLQLIASESPPEVCLIVNKSLRKQLDERYQSISDVLMDLQRVKQTLQYEELKLRFRPEGTQAPDPEGAAVLADRKEPNLTSSSESLPPNNLSAELSSLIGRESELEAIGALLEQGDVRLVTITGAGGSGKTRLAQAIAHKLLAKFADGVYFIDLSAIAGAELIVPIVAQTLAVREENGRPLKECLHEHLQHRRILLVLDNFEQITEAAAEIAEFLSVSLDLKILVTSRIRLYLRFEHEFPLAPLAVPLDQCQLAKEMHQYPAVKLFVERARALKPSFDLTDENAAAVGQICRRLDGLPLAIELAAVRIKLFAPQAILTRLSNSLNLLTGGSRDLPERQQTMRGAIGWSYDLLEEEEKKLLNRLAVFAGGFTLEGAEAIVEAGEVLRVDLLNSAASLVDKSLLSQRELPDGEPRFRMLQIVREFALDRLAASSEADKIKSVHAKFYAALAEEAQGELSGPSGAQWYEILEREHDNLRSALDWTLIHHPEVSLRLVSALGGFWVRHGYLAEGLKWSKQALEQSRGDDQVLKLQAKTCCNIGSLSWHQGDLVTAELFNNEGLRLSRLIGAKETICAALNGLGIVKLQQDELTKGKLLLEESLSVAREINDKFQIPRRLNNLGEIARMEKDFEAARRYYEEAYTIAKQESPSDVSVFSCNLGAISVLLGDYQSARSYSLIALEVSEAMGHKRAIGFALDNFAALAAENGQIEKAARLWGAAQSIKEAIGYRLEGVDKDFNDHYVGEARSAIGDEAFDASFEAGRLTPLKNALTLARESD